MPSASTTFLDRLAGAAAAGVGVGGGGVGVVSAMLLLCDHFLLSSDGAPRPLLGPGVGVGPLASHGKPPLVPRPAIAPDIHQSLDVHRDFRAQGAFHLDL